MRAWPLKREEWPFPKNAEMGTCAKIRHESSAEILKEGLGKRKADLRASSSGRGLSPLKRASGCDLEGDFLSFAWLLLPGDAFPESLGLNG
jgi:hypothetical protein